MEIIYQNNSQIYMTQKNHSKIVLICADLLMILQIVTNG